MWWVMWRDILIFVTLSLHVRRSAHWEGQNTTVCLCGPMGGPSTIQHRPPPPNICDGTSVQYTERSAHHVLFAPLGLPQNGHVNSDIAGVSG